MGILTGNIPRTSGSVFVNGISVDNAVEYLKSLGYCPQVDPLLDLMTAEEMLWFYGRIRCIKADHLKVRVSNLMQMIGLDDHSNRCCGTFSGGNKRKLSLGCAMIGDPNLLILDEPSCGMDPIARSKMSKLIYKLANRRSVVLVSHAMDECEALCSTIAILAPFNKDKLNKNVDPRHGFLALGSPQQIKAHFKAGYDIEIRFIKGGLLESMFGKLQSTPLPPETVCSKCGAAANFFPISSNSRCQICNLTEFLESIECSVEDLNRVYTALHTSYNLKHEPFPHYFSQYEPAITVVLFLSKLVESVCQWSISELDENFVKIRCEMASSLISSNSFEHSNANTKHSSEVKSTVPQEDLSLHYLFSRLENNQKKMCIVDYSISQLSLEHVFLTLAEIEQGKSQSDQ